MAKEDVSIHINEDRGAKTQNEKEGDSVLAVQPHTEVKNANAAGMGAMGRSEEKLDDSGAEKREDPAT